MNKQSNQNKHSGNGRRGIYRFLCILFFIIFLCCLIWIIAYFRGQRQAAEQLEEIRGSYVLEQSGENSSKEESGHQQDPPQKESPTPGETSEEEDQQQQELQKLSEELEPYGVSLTDQMVDIKALQGEVNPDIYAWIRVPGTVIDYPVLQHPEEMDYYLDYNLDGTRGYPGCIYTQRMNGKDFTDPNTVLYGHNMKAGTMFAALHKFKDADFFKNNRYIHIYTEDDRVLIYEIVAAYVNSNEHLLMNYMIHTEEGFQQYLDGIYEHTGSGCNFLTERELQASDRLITLSTCISGQDDKRYLVQGVLVYEAEIPNR